MRTHLWIHQNVWIQQNVWIHPNVATKWFSTAVHRSCWDAGKVQVTR